MKKLTSVIIIICLSNFLLISCTKNAENEVYEKSQFKMDTVMTLKAYGPNAKTAIEEAFKRVDEIEQLASPSAQSSEVNRINEAAGKEYVKIHPEIFKMVKTSIVYSKLSAGAFDITIGPIIKLWNIGTENEGIPSDKEIKEKLTLVGYDKIMLNESDNSIMLTKPGMSIDLGGVAKGFTADEIVRIFNKYNIKSAIINLGGSSIYLVGKKVDAKPWSVGVQHPRKEQNQDYLAIIRTFDKSVSSSGDYERYFIKDNKRYHHILSPFTGYPVDNGVIANTIVIDGSVPDSSLIADILSTTVFSLGVDKGIKLVESFPKTDCMITTFDFKVYTSNEFKNNVESLNQDFKFAGGGS